MRVGGQQFEITRINQYGIGPYPAISDLFGTVVECVGNKAPTWHGLFMPITDTGISELDDQDTYIGKFEINKGKVTMHLVLRNSLPLIEKR